MKMKKSGLKFSKKWLVLWSLWAMRLVRQPTEIVVIESGTLRGSVSHDGTHKNYLGIPYATVSQRFKAPGPEPKWKDIFEAVNEQVMCTQKWGDYIVVGQEDCLVINIFTPLHANQNENFPVMVFIHGGGFIWGSGGRFIYGPEYLVAKDIILVTFNYRLESPGFLCLRIKEAPGNAGLKDQVAALRWVKRNIKAFGGDPDNVTLFGQSAGGGSVSLHMLSKMSNGLFHKAILQSGSSMTPWAVTSQPIKAANKLATVLGSDTVSPHKLYCLFMNKTITELVGAIIPRPEGGDLISELFFLPCVETKIFDEEPFLTDTPFNILQSGEYTKVPIITGTNKDEGLFVLGLENDSSLSKISFDKVLSQHMTLDNVEKIKDIAIDVKKIYFGHSDETLLNKDGFSKFVTDFYFAFPSAEETELILSTSANQPVYNYLFDYSGWRNFVKFIISRNAFKPGACHADELLYLFKPRILSSMFEDKMIDTMTTIWTNFAKFGEPDPEGWRPTNISNPQVQTLGSTNTQGLWQSSSLQFWKELLKKYRPKQKSRSNDISV